MCRPGQRRCSLRTLAGTPRSRLSPAAHSETLQLSRRIPSKQMASWMGREAAQGRTHCLASLLLASSSAVLTQGQDHKVDCALGSGFSFLLPALLLSLMPIALLCIRVKQHVNKQLLCLGGSLTLSFLGLSWYMGTSWGGIPFLLVWCDATSLPGGLSQDLAL